MKFTSAPPNPYYDDWDFIKRLESENGRWTIALLPVLFDVRVQAGLTNKPFLVLDVSCGKEMSDIVIVFLIVKLWLESFPEDVSLSEIYTAWPDFPIKPVFLNPEWDSFIRTVIED